MFELRYTGFWPTTAQWHRDGVPVDGATFGWACGTPMVTPDDDDAVYHCVITNAAGTVTSETATLHVTAATAPAITLQPVDRTVYVHEAASFRLEATGTPPLTYAWKKNGVAIPDMNFARAVIMIDDLADDGAGIQCVVSNGAGSATSDTVTLNVSMPPEPALTTVPGGGQPGGPAYSFHMGTYEITNADYCRFLNDAQAHPGETRGANAHVDTYGRVSFTPKHEYESELFKTTGGRIAYNRYTFVGERFSVWPGTEDHPVACVSWYGAAKYCNWLTIYHGRGEASRCYSEGPALDDWHPVGMTRAQWLAGFSNSRRLAWITDPTAKYGYRLPMIGTYTNPLQADPYGEFYKAAAWDGTANRTYGFGRDSLGSRDANYLDSGDPFEADGGSLENGGPASPVGFFNGTTWTRAAGGWIGGPATFTTNANNNYYGIHDLCGNVWEWANEGRESAGYYYGRIYGSGHCGSQLNCMANYYGRAWQLDDPDYNNGLRILTMVDTITSVPPMIISAEVTDANAGDLYEYTLFATGTPPPDFSVSGEPAWLSLDGGVLSGTPGLGDGGVTGTLTITATNLGGADEQSFAVTVTEAPVIGSLPPVTAYEGALYSYDIATVGYPAPTVSASGEPTWLGLVGNELSGTPGPGDVGLTGTITVTASNGIGSPATQQFAIDVSVPVAPSAPVVGGDASPTGDAAPTWTWGSGGGGAGYFRYGFAEDVWIEEDVTDTSHTPAPLGEGPHTLHVQERNAVAQWSTSGTYQILVDLTAPVVTVDLLLTEDRTPALGGTVDDAAATISVAVWGQTVAATNNGDGTWTLPDNALAALANSTYDVQVTATDPAGNAASDGTIDELVVDVPPRTGSGGGCAPGPGSGVPAALAAVAFAAFAARGRKGRRRSAR